MRQAILLEPSDLAALKAGTPLTLSVGGVDLLLYVLGKKPLLHMSFSGMQTLTQETDGVRSDPRVVPPKPKRRVWTMAKRRELVQAYLKLKPGTGDRVALLRRRRVSAGHFHHMMKEVMEKKKP